MKRVMENERGSTLILVLLVVLVFTVLGLSLLSGTVGEKKRTVNTESSSQAQQYALDGLTFFETKFNGDFTSESSDSVDLIDYLDTVGESTEADKILTNSEIEASFTYPQKPIETSGQYNKKEFNIKVKSTGTDGSTERILWGYYRPLFLFYDDDVVYDISKFDRSAKPLDFTNNDVINVKLLNNLLTADVLDIGGSTKKYYRIPYNGTVLESNLLGGSLSLSLRLGKQGDFSYVENNHIIAVNKGELLSAILGENLFNISVLGYTRVDNVNVLIDGGSTYGLVRLGLLDYILGLGKLLSKVLSGLGLDFILNTGSFTFNDIDFHKLTVMGNVIINQNKEDLLSDRSKRNEPLNTRRRGFSFTNGLYVDQSLVIGNNQTKNSKLKLNGDMVVMKDLYINRADVAIDPETNIYVHGDATIENACISDGNGKFRVFTKGKLTIINNHSSCRELDGLYYAEGGINIVTNGNKLTINGGLIGDVTIDPPEDDPEKLEINWDEEYLRGIKIKNIDLLPQGRVLE